MPAAVKVSDKLYSALVSAKPTTVVSPSNASVRVPMIVTAIILFPLPIETKLRRLKPDQPDCRGRLVAILEEEWIPARISIERHMDYESGALVVMKCQGKCGRTRTFRSVPNTRDFQDKPFGWLRINFSS